MRARVWLLASIGLSLALALGWFVGTRENPSSAHPVAAKPPKAFNPFEREVKTNYVVRRINFTWHEVESDDYVSYIKNLRAIGCPQQTIRDIIVADVNQLYAHRR